MTRPRLFLLILLLGVAAWFVARSFHRYDYVNFPPTATGPWVAFGDSLTEGYGASEGKDYPTVLAQKLGLKILNLGKAGETSADGLARVEQVAQLQPRVVLLCFGGNDGLERSSRDKMFRNLNAMINRLRQEGSFVVLIGIRSTTLRDQNAELFQDFARTNKVFLVPNILKGIFPKPLYMSDAVHPNDEGYRLIAERLEKELRPLIKKSQGSLLHGG